LLRSTDCPSPRIPLDDARSSPQNRALVTSGKGVGRNSGGLPSAARRRRCAPAPFQPSLRLCCTSSARRPQTEALEERFYNSYLSSKSLQARARTAHGWTSKLIAPLLMKSDCEELDSERQMNEIREQIFKKILARLAQENLIMVRIDVDAEQDSSINNNQLP
jgi:hypothetical protein